MTKQERTVRFYNNMRGLGFTFDEANALRRIEMTLQRWGELECGNSDNYNSWAIERDETDTYVCTQCGHHGDGNGNCEKCGDAAPVRHIATGKPYMVIHPYDGKTHRSPVADREKGALKRLAKIMEAHPELWSYHQGDPRGCALHIGRKSDVNGCDLNSCYTRGMAVCV